MSKAPCTWQAGIAFMQENEPDQLSLRAVFIALALPCLPCLLYHGRSQVRRMVSEVELIRLLSFGGRALGV